MNIPLRDIKVEHDLRADGFCILKSVFTQEEVQKLRSLLVEISEFAELNREDPFTRYYLRHRADQGVLYDLFQRHPEFDAFARNSEILDVIADQVGPDIILYENSVVYKPKGKRNGVPFHQDFISRPDEPRKYIAWMALEPVKREGGALKVIPGSHEGGFLPWHRVRGETHHDRINTDALEVNNAVHVELNPGDVLIFNQLIVHGSDEAHTDALRLVYRVSYQGFDEIYSPGGTPIVLRGGQPSQLKGRYKAPFREQGKIVTIINKIGRRLFEYRR